MKDVIRDDSDYISAAEEIIQEHESQLQEYNRRINAISKEVNSLQKKGEIAKDKDLEDVVKLLAEKINEEAHYDLSLETKNRLFEIGGKTGDCEVANSVLTILTFIDPAKLSGNDRKRKMFGKVLSQISLNKQNIDLVIKLLDVPLCNTGCLSFLRDVVLNCKEAVIRESVCRHLDGIDNLPGAIQRLITLEKTDIVKDSKQLVALVEEMVRNHEQLRQIFIDNIKEQFSQIKTVTDTTKNIVKISKLLVENGDLRLSELGNLCFLLDKEELCDDILDIIEKGFVVEHDISKDLLDKVKKISASRQKAKDFVERLNSYLDEDVRILGNPRNVLEQRQAILKKFKETGHYAQNIVKLLENLIRYDKALREEAFELLQEILMSQDGGVGSFLMEFGYLVTTDNIGRFIDKDKSLDYSFLGKLLITRAENGEECALELIKRVTTEQDGFVLAREFVKNNLPVLITRAVIIANQSFREAVYGIIDNNITQDEIIAQPDGKYLYNFFYSILIKLIENYANINSSIKELSDKSQQEHQRELIKKLAELNNFQGIESYAEIFGVIDTNPELMEFVETSKLILDGLESDQAVSDKILNNIIAKLASEIDSKELRANLISILGILVNQRPEIQISREVLEKISGYLTDSEEEIALKITTVSIVLKYISDNPQLSKIPDSIHTSLISVLKELHENQSGASKLREGGILHKLVFDSLSALVKLNKEAENYLYAHYCESYPEISEYINTDAVKELNKFRLIRALSANILVIGKFNSNIFKGYDENQWQKELLLSTLVTRLSSNAEINDIKLEDLYKNIDVLELKLASVPTSDKDIHINMDDVMQLLINTQLINNLTIEEVNDIVTFLGTATDDANFMSFISGDIILLIPELRKIWLESRLQLLEIAYENNTLEQLNLLLPYSECYDTR